MKTETIIAKCRNRDADLQRYPIVLCGNTETLCDGYDLEPWEEETAIEAVSAAGRLILEAGGDYEVDSNFREWHGGRHYKCGGIVGYRKWGYSAGIAVCHNREVPAPVKELCDKATEAMADVFISAETRIAKENEL